MTAAEPSEKEVKAMILSTLKSDSSEGAAEFRPNKLRKMVCKKVQGATWTQFAKCLESMVGDKVVERKEKGGETFISMLGTSSSAGDNSGEKEVDTSLKTKKQASGTGAGNEDKAAEGSNIRKEEMRIPRAVALHLHKKRHLKLKNIEINTKTKLIVFGNMGGKQTAETLNEMHTLQISAELVNLKEHESDKDNRKASRELAKKHLKAAQLLVKAMVMAHKKNPERFVPNKDFGGTFQEQATREEEARLASEKRKEHSKGKDEPVEDDKKIKNKRTKFF